MKYILNKNQFESLLKYAIANGQNVNADRCIVTNIIISSVSYSATICFNEKKNSVVICEIFKLVSCVVEHNDKMIETDERDPDGEEESEGLKIECFNELLRLASEDWIMGEKDKRSYEIYKEKIEPATECCELNQ